MCGGGGSGRNRTVDFRGQRRRNDTHASSTDPQARRYRKARSRPAQQCDIGHALMENRHGLLVDTRLTKATGSRRRASSARTSCAGSSPSRRWPTTQCAYRGCWRPAEMALMATDAVRASGKPIDTGTRYRSAKDPANLDPLAGSLDHQQRYLHANFSGPLRVLHQ